MAHELATLDLDYHKGVYQILTSNTNEISENKPIFFNGLTGDELTFGEFKRNTRRLAAGLINTAGFRRGDVVAIFSTNQVWKYHP